VAAALLGSGLALGNYLLLALSAAPVFALLAPVTLGRPQVQVRRRVHPEDPRSGETVTCTLEVQVAGGPGLVEVHQDLPDAFRLVDGSNVHVLAAGTGTRRETLEFTFETTTRGDHALTPVDVEVADPAGLLAPETATRAGEEPLDVAPPAEDVPPVRRLESRARDLVPEGDPSDLGLRTTAFRDIREYAWGDPPRAVNWKATARRLSGAPPDGGAQPLVNEYERQGRQSVWIFLDAGETMRVGTELDNALDHAARGAASLARFFLHQGCTVGGAAYRAQGDPMIPPGSGPKQAEKLRQAFAGAQPGDDGGLAAAVERSRVHLAVEDPLVVVFTRAGADPDDAADGVRRVHEVASRGSALPVLVVSPSADALLPEARGEAGGAARRAAGAAGAALEAQGLSRVREAGAHVLSWDPDAHPLEDLLRKGMRA
jgi:uncharacterized protein (DUF58 family)